MNPEAQRTILIVEDIAATAMIVTKKLRRFGYRSITVSTGEEALALAATDTEIGLILMDIMLGSGIDGAEAARRILAVRNIPIVFLTSHTELEIVEKVKGLTRYGYILKNCDNHVFRTSIEMAFELFDAHERKRVSEERYQRIVEGLTDYVYTVSIHDGRPDSTVHSTACEIVTGYTADEYAADPYLWLRMVMEDDRDLVLSRISSIIAEKKAPPIEHRIVRKDGQVRWVSDVIIPHLDADGSLISYDGIVKDITDRKRTEAAIEEGEHRFKSIVDSSPMGMHSYELRDNGDLIFIGGNPAADKILGVDNSEFIGKTIEEAFPPLLQTEVPQKYREVAETGSGWKTEQITYDDAKIRGAFEVVAFRIAKNRMAALFYDLTGRKQAEPALDTQNRLLNAMLDNLPIGIFMVKADDGSVLLANDHAKKLLGRGILPGATPENLTEVYQVYKAGTMEKYPPDAMPIRVGMGGVYSHTSDMEVERSDGSRILLEIFGSPVFDSNGRVWASLVGFFDITERRRAEERQKKLEDSLFRAQRTESIGTLAAGIAHDFNNILGAISGNAELLAAIPGNPVKVQRRIDSIITASERGSNVVRQLLTYARKTEILHLAIDVNDVIGEVSRLMKETFPKTIVVGSALLPHATFVRGDSNQLYQVLLNLCVNARDAMPSGGAINFVTSIVHGSDIAFQFPAALPRPYIAISVKDTGTGMDEATLKRIFDPYFTTKAQGKGTGLGLAVALGIIDNHAGFIDIRSEVGCGTEFILYLPLLDEAVPANGRTDEAAAAAPGGHEIVLVIEDEELVREMAVTVLEENGYTVLTADDGEEGVDAYRRNSKKIALVITDYGLPKFDGEEVYKRIKAINPAVPCMILSGFMEPEKKVSLMRAGVAATLTKPYKSFDLLTTVRTLLDARSVSPTQRELDPAANASGTASV